MMRLHRFRPWLQSGVLLIAAAQANAGIRVDLDGVDGEVRRNVQAFLSVERYKDRDNLEAEGKCRPRLHPPTSGRPDPPGRAGRPVWPRPTPPWALASDLASATARSDTGPSRCEPAFARRWARPSRRP